jgi:hypothetical protein
MLVRFWITRVTYSDIYSRYIVVLEAGQFELSASIPFLMNKAKTGYK